jgi:hypothetical protein
MKEFDKRIRAFRGHVRTCPTCAKVRDTTDFQGLKLCDTGYALSTELCDSMTRDEQFMRLLRNICWRKAS